MESLGLKDAAASLRCQTIVTTPRVARGDGGEERCRSPDPFMLEASWQRTGLPRKARVRRTHSNTSLIVVTLLVDRLDALNCTRLRSCKLSTSTAPPHF